LKLSKKCGILRLRHCAPKEENALELLTSAVVNAAFGIAIGFGTASFGLGYLDHSGHTPMPIPDSWTETEVAAFIAQSDRRIDARAGRVIAPGEAITHEGHEFRKSTPEMVAQRRCNWCSQHYACHKTKW
jgi:hypothetical protein